MEQEFRTTFIPKKPIAAPQSTSQKVTYSKPVGIVFTVSLIVLIISAALGGGVYFYKNYLIEQVSGLDSSLQKLQQNIDPKVIKEFTVVDKRLKNSETLVNQHTVLSPLFTVLRTATLPEIRYTKLDMSFNETHDLQVTLSGESDGYRSIALQSQALARTTNLKNTIFSNFVVTPKGRVSFDVTFTIPVSDLTFAKNIDGFSGTLKDNQITSIKSVALPQNESGNTINTSETIIEDSTVEFTNNQEFDTSETKETLDSVIGER